MFALALLLAFSAAEIITIIGVATTSVIGIITALGTLKNRDQIAVVRKEVTTMNGQTLAMLADANETRRVDDIPVADRTDMEADHIASVTESGLDPEGRDNTTEDQVAVTDAKLAEAEPAGR